MSESEKRIAKRPLDGVRVIEAGQMIAGPFTGHLLADFGAEVIKLEAPDRPDPIRTWGAMYKGVGLYWPILARGKKAATLNLRVPRGQELFKSLIRRCDVLVENFRPGTLEEWGLGWDVLHEVNPRLVMVRVTGYGQTGPYRDKAGFGAIGEAVSGLRFLTGEPGRRPVRSGVALGDTLAGTFGVIGAMLALYARDAAGGTGRGQIVDVGMYEAIWTQLEDILPEFEKLGRVRQPVGPVLPGISPSNVYPTSGGDWIVMGANQDQVFGRLCDLMGHPEWKADERFKTHVARGEHQELLDNLISAWTETLDADTLLEKLDGAGIPANRIFSAADIASDPHYAAREMIVSVLDKQIGEEVRMQGVVPKLEATPGRVEAGSPGFGEHNAEIWGQLVGLPDAEIERLKSEGVI
jgi:crotonobetainyl-CoA:carnitine CoA-transferase CaiB-like acyl-CoA transferase